MSQVNTHWTLYTLKLEQGKYYVGITSQSPEKRLWEHRHGRKTYWTAMHPPVKIIFSKNLGAIDRKRAEKQENRLTRELMRQRGINNVRGGDLTDTENYIQRFGNIYTENIWQLMSVTILFMLISLTLILDKLDWNLWVVVGGALAIAGGELFERVRTRKKPTKQIVDA